MKPLLKLVLLFTLLTVIILDNQVIAQRRPVLGGTASQFERAASQADVKIAKIVDTAAAQVMANASKEFDIEALQATTTISNQSGAKIVADFYATSPNDNVAISPPTMVATFSALTHIAKGKTKEELRKLLSLDGNEKPAFDMLGKYLTGSHEVLAEACKKLFGNDKEFQRLLETENRDGMPLEAALNNEGSRYNSLGYLLVNSSIGSLDSAAQKAILGNFGTRCIATNFSEADVKKINEEIAQIVGEEFDEVIQSVPEANSLNVCSAMYFFQSWYWIMEGTTRPFNFDRGKKKR